MDQVHKERLLRLADFLEHELPPEKFSYGDVVRGPDMPRKEMDCGSVACAIGWCPVIFPDLASYAKARFGPNFYVISKTPSGDTSWSFDEAGMNLFGLSLDESEALFDPFYSDDSREEMGLEPVDENSSAIEVAANIRAFVKYKEAQQ
jgi:hypothetical protein